MDRFNQMIFLGNGDASMANSYRLHRMLEEALITLGGVQQGAFNAGENQRALIDVDFAAKQIYIALTGKYPS